VSYVESEPDLARLTVSTELRPGQTLRIVKFLAYGWSSQRSLPAVRDQVDAALAAAKRTGWAGLRSSQRDYLDDVWARADVELDGDPALQQAVRFPLFQVVEAGARAERRAIPAKGLTGSGYDGHSFWDMETYTLPVLTYVAPEAARDALLWRHSTMDLAEPRARELSLDGVTFPWRTIRGQECSGYWPAGTAAFHINAGSRRSSPALSSASSTAVATPGVRTPAAAAVAASAAPRALTAVLSAGRPAQSRRCRRRRRRGRTRNSPVGAPGARRVTRTAE
jgi:trehalose/maltose hydrolase-like predicted phosphorylase